jgi:hypothetical protein
MGETSGSTLHDSTGNGSDAQKTSASDPVPASGDGLLGGTQLFTNTTFTPSASSGFAQTSLSSSTDISAGAGLTISAILNSTQSSVYAGIYRRTGSASDSVTAAQVALTMNDASGNDITYWVGGVPVHFANAVATNVWEHITLTHDFHTGLVSLYGNGVLLGTQTLPVNPTPAPNYIDVLGNRAYALSSHTFPGSLQQITVSAGVYSADHIAAEYNAENDVSSFLSVGFAGTQNITFDAISPQIVGSTINLSASTSSGLSITFSSATLSVCSVSGNIVSLSAPGQCSIIASQPGNASYAPAASVTQSFSVSAATQTITFATIPTQSVASNLMLAATASSSLPVTLTSNTPSICVTSGSSASLLAVGTCTIVASQEGNGTYAAASPVMQSFPVNLQNQTITFGPITPQTAGSTFSLHATTSSTLPLEFVSTTPTVCTVSGSTASLIAAGACSITVGQTGGSTYAPAIPTTQSFTVNLHAQSITFAPITPQTVGTNLVITASASSELPISYTSKTSSICSLSGNSAKLLAAGTCTITASQSGNSIYAAAATVSQSLSVITQSQIITFDSIPVQTIGSTLSLNASSSSGLPVTFTSSPSAVCSAPVSVSANGFVAWGDALTAGNEDGTGVRYPSTLGSLFSANVANEGIGAQTSAQIGVRQGGIPTTATIVGGTIPASGGVTVTFPSGYEPVTSQGPSGTNGAISGIHGLVTLSAGVYTFTRSAAGNAISVTSAPFVVDTPYANAYALIWAGRGDYTSSTVVSNIRKMVASLPNPGRYLVLSVLNGNYPTEVSGQPNYTKIMNLNASLKSAFPSNYLDIHSILIANYNPANPEDVLDQSNDVVPSSFRAVDTKGTITSAIASTAACSANAPITLSANSSSHVLSIDTEKIWVTAVSGTSVTGCVRGYAGTVAATHAAGAAYTGIDPLHLNAAGYTLVAQQISKWLQTNVPTTVALTGSGTCTITASQPGNTTYSPAPQVPQLVTVNAGS